MINELMMQKELENMTAFEQRCFRIEVNKRLPGLIRDAARGGDYENAMSERLPELVEKCVEVAKDGRK